MGKTTIFHVRNYRRDIILIHLQRIKCSTSYSYFLRYIPDHCSYMSYFLRERLSRISGHGIGNRACFYHQNDLSYDFHCGVFASVARTIEKEVAYLTKFCENLFINGFFSCTGKNYMPKAWSDPQSRPTVPPHPAHSSNNQFSLWNKNCVPDKTSAVQP